LSAAAGREAVIVSEPQSLSLPDTVTVHELAEAMDQKVSTVITALMKNGVLATINDRLDHDTASIIAGELGFSVTEKAATEPVEAAPERRKKQHAGSSPRPPVVAVMGHVDHGKTTLLDAIRSSDLVSREAGGITQHISAYRAEHKGRAITLLDTPGHAAFAALRQHGAALTDVAVIVVAADDGVKPQTKEAIDFARKAGVPMMVALTKVDKPGADTKKTKQQLSEAGLTPEDWGGDTVVAEVSGKTREGVGHLLDMILLVADINELTADESLPAEGIVIESHMAVGQGPVATLLVEHGVLRPGQFVVAGTTYAKIRSMDDEYSRSTREAGPSRAVSVSGFKQVPNFGETFSVVANEKLARAAAQSAAHERGTERTQAVKSIATAEDLLQSIETERSHKALRVILKADVRGSLESLSKSLEDIGTDEVGVEVVSSGVGNVSESDVSVAKSSGAIVLGFHVGVSTAVKRMAARDGVEVKLYSVIYELLDDAKALLEDLLSPEVIETKLASLEVKGVFRITRDRLVCGGEVTEGKLTPGLAARLWHGKTELAEAKLANLQKGQHDTKEVVAGELCGLELTTEKKIPLTIGDRVDFFKRETRRRTLG
jgi:translation initiation factor IF-2